MKFLIGSAAVLLLAGCAITANTQLPDVPHYPSDAWVEENLPAYRQAAEDFPFDRNLRKVVDRLNTFADWRGRAEAKDHLLDRKLTLAWDNHGRGGAALRQPAYVHVLGEPFVGEPSDISAGKDGLNQVGSNASGKANTSPSGTAAGHDWLVVDRAYSIYEMARWERFCDTGKGMDEVDWQFISQEGGNKHIPELLVVDCQPPSYQHWDYLDAWMRVCEDNEPTAEDREIVSLTVRPKSVVSMCSAPAKQ